MRVLDGIRVVDWTVMQAGPMSTTMLGDLGAEIIKIEDPVRGDISRGVRLLGGCKVPVVNDRNAYYEAMNRNKKGITLDLNQKEGQEVVYRLIEKSDVFVHNRPERDINKRNLDYETLSRYNPKLIYMSLPGFGTTGPLKDALSFDISGQALSGMMFKSGEIGTPPTFMQGGPIDQAAGILASHAIITGLLARERFGIGQKLESSSLSAAIYLQVVNVQMQLFSGNSLGRLDRTKVDNPLLNTYQCKDGNWILLTAIVSDRFWKPFCEATGRQDLIDNPKFNSHLKRSENNEELIQIIDKILATKTREEWVSLFDHYGMMNAPILQLEESINHPQVLANKDIIEWDHPSWGKVRMVNYPIRFSKTPAEIRMPAPMFGQHTEEVLTEILGMNWEDINTLKEKHVIA